MLDWTFTSLADAMSHFHNNVIDLGAIDGGVSEDNILDLKFDMTLTAS